jgi:ribonuclease-3
MQDPKGTASERCAAADTSGKRTEETSSSRLSKAERIERAEAICGHHFAHPDLLIEALTHPSAVGADMAETPYERLEFLGDSLLGAFVARALFDRFPELDEGGLTRIKVSLVSGSMLSERAQALGLAELIIFGSSERGTGKRGLHSALENVFEALIAALALDGGEEVARAWVIGVLDEHIRESVAAKPENPKSALLEMLQVWRITPTYELVETSGPPHARVFTCNVLSDEKVIGTGSGHSKKDAEAKAAAAALAGLRAARRPGFRTPRQSAKSTASQSGASTPRQPAKMEQTAGESDVSPAQT